LSRSTQEVYLAKEEGGCFLDVRALLPQLMESYIK